MSWFLRGRWGLCNIQDLKKGTQVTCVDSSKGQDYQFVAQHLVEAKQKGLEIFVNQRLGIPQLHDHYTSHINF